MSNEFVCSLSSGSVIRYFYVSDTGNKIYIYAFIYVNIRVANTEYNNIIL